MGTNVVTHVDHLLSHRDRITAVTRLGGKINRPRESTLKRIGLD
jgi:hypothetical protein